MRSPQGRSSHGADLVAGWQSAEAPDWDEEETGERGCDPDLSRFTLVGRAHAGFGRDPGAYLGVEMKVFESEADAQGDFRVRARIDAVACIKAAAGQAGPTAPTRLVSAKVLPAPRIGERAMHLEMKMSVAARGRRIPVYLDMLQFQKGRA